ncbi:RNA pyrophosphohydrolase [Maricaulis sp. D1M11]|uniref:RNA pyrophosphohydrolase n=1 Tax=Maricaulis sp. D1M11 TaxID=3076117 RepID=UPI0039B4C8BC
MERDLSLYRPNAGIALFNAEGKVWLGRRNLAEPPWQWQLPQGGMDEGEDPLDAAQRELFEETGIRSDKVRLLGSINEWLTYDYPPEVRDDPRFHKKRHLGQKQRWFAFEFLGMDSDFDLEAHGEIEFDTWRWAELSDLPNLIIPWKRPVYAAVVEAFTPFAR